MKRVEWLLWFWNGHTFYCTLTCIAISLLKKKGVCVKRGLQLHWKERAPAPRATHQITALHICNWRRRSPNGTGPIVMQWGDGEYGVEHAARDFFHIFFPTPSCAATKAYRRINNKKTQLNFKRVGWKTATKNHITILWPCVAIKHFVRTLLGG